MAVCEYCGKELDEDLMTDARDVDDGTIYLCCPNCAEDYDG
jgi:hypothetical protein